MRAQLGGVVAHGGAVGEPVELARRARPGGRAREHAAPLDREAERVRAEPPAREPRVGAVPAPVARARARRGRRSPGRARCSPGRGSRPTSRCAGRRSPGARRPRSGTRRSRCPRGSCCGKSRAARPARRERGEEQRQQQRRGARAAQSKCPEAAARPAASAPGAVPMARGVCDLSRKAAACAPRPTALAAARRRRRPASAHHTLDGHAPGRARRLLRRGLVDHALAARHRRADARRAAHLAAGAQPRERRASRSTDEDPGAGVAGPVTRGVAAGGARARRAQAGGDRVQLRRRPVTPPWTTDDDPRPASSPAGTRPAPSSERRPTTSSG